MFILGPVSSPPGIGSATARPPSQVVHTIPRGAGPPVPSITSANVPPISATPAPGALITFVNNQVRIPN